MNTADTVDQVRKDTAAQAAPYAGDAGLAALPLLLLWPALRQTVEGRMSLHMLLEFPLLFAAGWAVQRLGPWCNGSIGAAGPAPRSPSWWQPAGCCPRCSTSLSDVTDCGRGEIRQLVAGCWPTAGAGSIRKYCCFWWATSPG